MRRLALAVLLATSAGVAGCTSLLGDDFHFDPAADDAGDADATDARADAASEADAEPGPDARDAGSDADADADHDAAIDGAIEAPADAGDEQDGDASDADANDASVPDVTPDAVDDVPVDGTSDAPPDVTSDVTSDATSDATVDATVDVASDTSVDVTADVAADASADAGADAPIDAPVDVSMDVGPDVTVDASMDATMDAAPDGPLVCGTGTADCDRLASNGCETDILSNPNDCGACGNVCVNAHGTTRCVSAVCTPSCDTAHADCNGNPADGCETSITSTVANCGGCNIACANSHGTTACVASVCTPTCDATHADCNGNPNDGCETSIASTTSNCGGCGVTCTNPSGSTTCNAGVCTPVCNQGHADCNSNPNDGCEADTTRDAANCGACCRVCTGASACVSGACVAPSCASGPSDGRTNCGPMANESCCASPAVQGGTISLDATHTATVSPYKLDKYEVTVGRFRAFVDALAAGWRPAAGSGKHAHLNGGRGLSDGAGGYEPGWDASWTSTFASFTSNDWATYLTCNSTYPATWSTSPNGHERLPIVCPTWYELYAFCIWDGGFLPSEAEWEYAAVGGVENRIYPWGSSAPDDAHAVFCGGDCTAPINVGSLIAGNGRYGHSDLAGNVWEWAVDGYVDPYPSATYTDSAPFSSTTYRSRRGGSFDNTATQMAGAFRNYNRPTGRSYNGGARCARIP